MSPRCEGRAVAAQGSSEDSLTGKTGNRPRFDSAFTHNGQPIYHMKKYICILASAALFAACEQRVETTAPAAPGDKKTEHNTTIVNPSPAGGTKSETNTTIVNPPPAGSTQTESSTSTTTSTPSDQ